MKDTSLALALSGLAFILAVICGNPLLRVLKHFKIRQDDPRGGP